MTVDYILSRLDRILEVGASGQVQLARDSLLALRNEIQRRGVHGAK